MDWGAEEEGGLGGRGVTEEGDSRGGVGRKGEGSKEWKKVVVEMGLR